MYFFSVTQKGGPSRDKFSFRQNWAIAEALFQKKVRLAQFVDFATTTQASSFEDKRSPSAGHHKMVSGSVDVGALIKSQKGYFGISVTALDRVIYHDNPNANILQPSVFKALIQTGFSFRRTPYSRFSSHTGVISKIPQLYASL